MAIFQIGETVICSITVKDEDGDLQDAATSMSITVLLHRNDSALQASTAMGNDGTGLYHKDIATSSAEKGLHDVFYTAVDGTRTTIQTDTFTLE